MATGTLTGTTIAATYKSILKVKGGANTVLHATTHQSVEDGDGNDSALSLAIDSVGITGSGKKLYFSDKDGEYISGDGTDLTITSGNDIILALGAAGSVYHTGDGGNLNTIYGYQAGIALASGGNNNTLIGNIAGTALVTGGDNVAIGYQALRRATGDGSTAADENVAIGRDSMGGNFTTADVNGCVAVGYDTLSGTLTSTAIGTVVIGLQAGKAITSGARNIAVGYQTLDALTQGDDNIALGHSAMGLLSTTDVSDRNIAIGNYAMDGVSSLAPTDNIFIGYDSGGGGWTGTLSKDNIGIGTSTLAAAMNAATQNIAIGVESLNDLTTGVANTMIGYRSGDKVTTSGYNVGVGFNALGAAVAGNDFNIAIGYDAMGNANHENCHHNVAVGAYALDAIGANASWGQVAIGYHALGETTSGLSNVAIGYQSGYYATTADGSTFVGYKSGQGITGAKLTGDNNTAIGNNAGLLLQGASTGNTLVGGTAGSSLTTGAYCTIIGEAAGATTTGSNNTFVGWRAGNDVTSGTASVAVGRQAGGDADVALTGANNTSVGDQAGVALQGSAAGNTLIGKNAGDGITTGDSNTVIGTNADISGVGVDDEIVIGAATTGQGTTVATIGNGNLTYLRAGDDAGGTFVGAGQSWSDKRIKENVKDIGLGLDFIKKLTPIQYTKKQPKDYEDSLKSKIYPSGSKQIVRNINDTELQRKRAGFIAQDVLEALKEIGFDENNGIVQIDEKTTQHSMDYASMVVPLVKAVQELSAKVKALEDA